MTQKKDTSSRKRKSLGENSEWLLKELGVYHEDPIIDKKINEELLMFLHQLGLKKAKIIIRNQ